MINMIKCYVVRKIDKSRGLTSRTAAVAAMIKQILHAGTAHAALGGDTIYTEVRRPVRLMVSARCSVADVARHTYIQLIQYTVAHRTREKVKHNLDRLRLAVLVLTRLNRGGKAGTWFNKELVDAASRIALSGTSCTSTQTSHTHTAAAAAAGYRPSIEYIDLNCTLYTRHTTRTEYRRGCCLVWRYTALAPILHYIVIRISHNLYRYIYCLLPMLRERDLTTSQRANSRLVVVGLVSCDHNTLYFILLYQLYCVPTT